MKSTARVRMQDGDARHPGGLVDGPRILGLFGDVGAELAQRAFGAAGHLRSYESVDFSAKVFPGDVLEVEGETISSDSSSITVRLEARKDSQIVARGRAIWAVTFR